MTRADRFGISSHYEDVFGRLHIVPPATRRALLVAMHVDPEDPAAPPPAPLVCIPEGRQVAAGRGTLRLEDGTERPIVGSFPRDLPAGYHRFAPDDGGPERRIIVHPSACWLPDDLRCWGWAVPLYATRSQASWGMGDLADLDQLAGWSRSVGADVLLLNPLAAGPPVVPQEPSPYQPSSRLFRSPLYVRIEEVEGAGETAEQWRPLAEAARALNADRQIDRDRVFSWKMEALRRIWSRARRDDPGLKAFASEAGELLTDFATYCVLAETMGADWRRWERPYRRPDSAAVRRFREEQADAVAFHQWVQWQLDQQFGRAAARIALVTDLPIGGAPSGADAWIWQDALAAEASVGAPPDRYNPHGQDWGIAPFIPHRLRETGYAPLIAVIRAAMRHARGLRIDHVMGVFRQFWVPAGMPPSQGAYVCYPAQEILGILALEAHRHQVWVAGEDLGTVQPEVRRELAAQRILTHRVMWFEDDPPPRYPRWSLAAVTTHDLPTVAGVWTGSDFQDERRLGREPGEEFARQIWERLQRAVGLGPEAPVDEVIVAAHRALAQAPSAVLIANLTDALAVAERLNMPGRSAWPNWSLALPASLEELQRAELAGRVAQAMHR